MTIITVYWILFLTGLAFAVISAVFVGFGEMMTGHDVDFSTGHDADLGGGADTVSFGDAHAGPDLASGDFYHGHGEIALSPVSPMTIFSFMGGFGGGGLIGYELGFPTWGSVLFALVLGFLIAFAVYFFMYKVNQMSASSEARASEAIGATAEIITPITDDGAGEIAYVSRGSRYNCPARSIDGKSINRGRVVKIWRLVGGTCFVKEILPEEAEQPPVDSKDQRDSSS